MKSRSRIKLLALVVLLICACGLPQGGGSPADIDTTSTAIFQAANATIQAQAAQGTITAIGAASTALAQQATANAQGIEATQLALSANATASALALQATAQAQAAPPPIAIPPTAYPVPMTRISFTAGATYAVIEGQLLRGEIADYAIRALAGQSMLITVSSANENVYLGVVGLLDGTPLQRTAADSTRFYLAQLPATQDYRLTLASPDQASTYSMQVIIPVRISFDPGAISTIIKGNVIGGSLNHHLAWAKKGQTMTVKIISANNDVFLIIYGMGDGVPLVRYISESTEWSGILPASQDYMIETVATGGTTDYKLKLTIQ